MQHKILKQEKNWVRTHLGKLFNINLIFLLKQYQYLFDKASLCGITINHTKKLTFNYAYDKENILFK